MASDAFVDGIVLAAVALGDRRLARVDDTLHPSLAEAGRARAARLDALTRQQRAEDLARMARRMRPRPPATPHQADPAPSGAREVWLRVAAQGDPSVAAAKERAELGEVLGGPEEGARWDG